MRDLNEQLANAIKERDKLGYAVVKLVEAVDEILNVSEEFEGPDGFTHESAPADFWADLRTAADDMTLRAEDFEEKYQSMVQR